MRRRLPAKNSDRYNRKSDVNFGSHVMGLSGHPLGDGGVSPTAEPETESANGELLPKHAIGCRA